VIGLYKKHLLKPYNGSRITHMEDGLVQSVWEARAGWRCFLDGLEGLKEAAGREPEILAEVFQEVTRDM
jgi:hypothetical protein